MRHYHLDIIVTDEEVKVLKNELTEFMESAGGFAIELIPDDIEVKPSPELHRIIQKMFVQVLIRAETGRFKGVN